MNGIEEDEAVRLLTEMMNHRPGEAAVAEECARIAERAMDGIVGAEIAMNIRSRFGGKA